MMQILVRWPCDSIVLQGQPLWLPFVLDRKCGAVASAKSRSIFLLQKRCNFCDRKIYIGLIELKMSGSLASTCFWVGPGGVCYNYLNKYLKQFYGEFFGKIVKKEKRGG